jgi:nucleoside-diphosphate-sugar epimerase
LAAEKFKKIQDKVINLGSGVETSLSSLAFLICNHAGVNSDLVKISDHGIPLRGQADIQLAQTLLNFKPAISLSHGIDIISDSLERS